MTPNHETQRVVIRYLAFLECMRSEVQFPECFGLFIYLFCTSFFFVSPLFVRHRLWRQRVVRRWLAPHESEVEGSIPGVLPFFCVSFSFSFFLLGTVCGFTTGYLDLIDFNYTCTLLYDIYTRVFICVYLSCISAAALCCYPAVAAAAVLLLAAVRRRVPDDVLCSCGVLHLIAVFSFSSFKHDLFLMYPWQYCCRLHGLDLPMLHPR